VLEYYYKGVDRMKRKTFWVSIIIGMVILLLLVLASHVISVGERLSGIHIALEYAFYVLALLIVWLLVLNPIRVIFMAPTFSIDALDSDQSTRTYKRAAKTMLKLDYLSDEERTLLNDHIKDPDNLRESIQTVFSGSIKKEVDKTIIHYSQSVLLTTAVSQNGNLDMLAVIFTNIRMIMRITKKCGFRPSYMHLAKLSINVAVTAMIAEGLEDVDINEALPSRVGDTIRDIPVVRGMTNSVFQGISNGMLTCRIGIVTRKYLFQDSKLHSPRKIRIEAYKESFRLMPQIISGGLANFPKGIVNYMIKPFFKNPFTKKGYENE